MGEELIVGFADPGFAIASYGPLVITVLREPSTVARLAELRRSLTRLVAQWPSGTFSLTVLERGAMVMAVPTEIREESTAIARDFPSLGSTIVVEGDGFAGATIRAFLSGLFLISGNRSQIHGSVDEATGWLARRMASMSPDHRAVSRSDLAAAVKGTREALR
jgi:hypothetical protein